MSSLAKKIVIVLSLLVLAYVSTGYVLGRSSDDKAFHALTVYSEVLQDIQTQYVDEPNIHQVTSGALHGLLDSLDPQSGYMSPLEYNDYKEKIARKSPATAGLALTKRFGYIGVVSALPDSPAAKAGLRIGDIFEKIGGFTTGQMAIAQAQVLLSGEPGTVVKLSVIKRGKTEPEAMDVTLAKVPAPKLAEDRLAGDIAYLRVGEFTEGITKQIRDKLAEFKSRGDHKLILDLRDCSLGVTQENYQEAISTAQLFLSTGTITTLKGQTVTPVVSSADSSKVVWTQPVDVLIGNGTAGPAEIVAAAIAGNHRGDAIGDRTFGTASMQKLIQMDDAAALILTVANYYTPDGKEIPAEGVAPTLEVRSVADDVASVNDFYPPLPSSSPDDPVVKKAIEMLQTPSAARKAA
ncbi:MAG TPA: S41 family peptidase [Candidatus Acidoferrales bacterium]|nr:S41 family peptidase [Candidatus Acidoferrales bacterium]